MSKVIIYAYAKLKKRGDEYVQVFIEKDYNQPIEIVDSLNALVARCEAQGYEAVLIKSSLYSYQISDYKPTTEDTVVLVNTEDRYCYRPRIGFRIFEAHTVEEIDRLFT